MGAGRAPSAGETSAVQATAQRPILHAKAPAVKKTREGRFLRILKHNSLMTPSDRSLFIVFQEMEQMQRYNQRMIEELKNKQTQEKARLPKIQRSDAKTRMAMFKKSLRITGAFVSPEQERERVKQVHPKNAT